MSDLIRTREHKKELFSDIAMVDKSSIKLVVKWDDENKIIETGYYIGLEWLTKNDTPLLVTPKLDDAVTETDYLGMLFKYLGKRYCGDETESLFEIRYEEQEIEINQKEDLLTPLIVLQFLMIIQNIAKKGLKKSYYKIENNLHARVKGKILIGKTIKQNLLKNKDLKTVCSYDEFGLNCPENRLLKRALQFVQRYLPTIIEFQKSPHLTGLELLLLQINSAFDGISNEIEPNEIKQGFKNTLYKEYDEGLRLAKLILQRFGYNIKNADTNEKIKIHPFWIDMSKLFELYVLGLLRDRFGDEIKYHFNSNANELDYLLKSDEDNYKPGMVIDAKYKPIYQGDGKWDIDNVRQLSGYSRLEAVYNELNKTHNEVVDCLIIYPDQKKGYKNLMSVNDFKGKPIENFVKFYKIAVKLPMIGESDE